MIFCVDEQRKEPVGANNDIQCMYFIHNFVVWNYCLKIIAYFLLKLSATIWNLNPGWRWFILRLSICHTHNMKRCPCSRDLGMFSCTGQRLARFEMHRMRYRGGTHSRFHIWETWTSPPDRWCAPPASDCRRPPPRCWTWHRPLSPHHCRLSS